MSPNDIEVILHCYTCRRRHDRFDAPPVRDALSGFLRAGLIQVTADEGVFECTEGGALLVKALCSVPYPSLVWKMPDGWPHD